MKKPKSDMPPKLRKFPKILADELLAALGAVSRLGPKLTMKLLKRYRRNRAKRIATWGVLNIGARVDGLEQIPAEHILWIERLDEAFRRMHHFKNGGAGDYAAADVESAIRSHHAKRPREKRNDYEAICAYLRRKDYESSENKKSLVTVAATFFDTSESTVYRAIRAGDLGRKKKSAVT